MKYDVGLQPIASEGKVDQHGIDSRGEDTIHEKRLLDAGQAKFSA